MSQPFDMADFLDRLTLLLSATSQLNMPPCSVYLPPQAVDALALKAARSGRAVLIRGGPGTGKELVARRIHEISDRLAAPFVPVNLAREADIGTALFPRGRHRRDRRGNAVSAWAEPAGRSDQLRLLAALDAGFEGRLIASCGYEMEAIVARGGFSAEVYFRLDMMEIPIPPLGERTEDAVWLMNQLFEKANARRAQR